MLSGALANVSMSRSLLYFFLISAISSSAFSLALSEKKPPSSTTVLAGLDRLLAWAWAVPENESQPTMTAGTNNHLVKCIIIVELLVRRRVAHTRFEHIRMGAFSIYYPG